MWKSMRLFSLQYSDLPTILKNISFLLRLTAINIDSNYKNRIPFIFLLLTGFNCASYIYVYQISMFWFVFIRCTQTKDYVAAYVEFSVGMCSFTGLAHFMYMLIYSNRTKYIVNKYLGCDKLVIKETRYYDNLLKLLRTIKKRALTIWTILWVNSSIYMFYPILTPGRHTPQDVYVVYGLEPVIKSPNYEIATIFKSAGVVFAGYMISNVIALYLVLYGYTEAHLLAMSNELNHLWEDGNKYFFKKENKNENIFNNRAHTVNKYIARQLNDLIQLHVDNRNLVTELEQGLKGTRVLVMASMTFANIAELLGGLENTFIQTPFTFVLLFMDCLAGQKIVDANGVFINALYTCKWEKFNVSNRRIILQMMQNAQKTMMISAGGFMNLNFASFASVIKFTYSTYTTLKSSVK